MFLDEAVIIVRSGRGGNGCVSFRREKFVPRGGPDGGDGGHGGSVYLEGSLDLTTLADISRQSLYAAEDGRPGAGNNKTGRSSEDLVLAVPAGTTVRMAGTDPQDAGCGPILGEILVDGQRLLVARGGKGGKGNKAFATATHQVPREFEEGEPGEERRLYLELKLLADVGLVGLPNAGKSTLLSRVSAATPKIASYPFTTLKPNLGIAEVGDYRRLVVADIPGLIEGAHEGAGLGIEFLRHVERTRVILHLVSVEAASAEQMEADYRTVEAELRAHSEALAGKPKIVLATKLDLLPPEEGRALLTALSARLERPVLGVSSVSGRGLQEALREAAKVVSESP